MSPLAKVFVVLNLLLAVILTGSFATLYTARENYVTSIESMKAEQNEIAKKSNQKLNDQATEIDRLANNSSALNVQVESLRSDNDTLKNEKSDLKAEVASKDGQIATLNSTLGDKERRLGDKDRDIARLTESNENLIAENQRARADKTAAETMAARFRLDLQNANGTLAETEIMLANASSKAEELQDTLEYLHARGIDVTVTMAPPPAIDARVLAVRPDANLVVLSTGSNDKVEIGHEFTIYRGETFIGKVQVTRVTPDLAGARIVFSEEAIQQGDAASTRVGGSL